MLAALVWALSMAMTGELVFLKLGPMFILGLAFLAGYGIIFVAAAAIAASMRKSEKDGATAG